MMSRVAVLVLASAGCDAVFSTALPPTTTDAAIDAEVVKYNGLLVRRLVHEGASITTSELPYTAAELTPSVLQAGMERPIEWTFDTGAWSFDGVRAPYRLLLAFGATPFIGEQQLAFERPSFIDLQYDRATAAVPQATTRVSGTIDEPERSDRYRFVTTGVWSETPFGALVIDATRSSFQFDWDRRLVDTNANDRVFLLGLEDRTGYASIVRMRQITNLFMQEGDNPVDAVLAPLPDVRCTTIDAPIQTLEDRLEAAYPDFPTLGPSWGIYGEPEPRLGPNIVAFLANSNAVGPIDVDYGDPYGNFTHIAVTSAWRQRRVSTGPGTSAAVTVFLREHVLVTADMCPGRATTTFPISTLEIPQRFRLAGRLITDDAAGAVAIGDATELDLTWEGANADLYSSALYEITGASAVGNLVRFYRTTEPRVIVDGASLETGKRYLFVVLAIRGFLDAASGDFTVVTYPHSTATGSSASFSVAR